MRYKCTVAYDGSLFHGFQIQGDLRTVQLEIENVLLIITKSPVRIHPAGRTDTGVHGIGQVFHFDTAVEMPAANMQNAINSRLPRDIYIKKVEIVDESFHSRFNAIEKTYYYLIDLGEYNPLYNHYRYYYKYPINLENMIEASKIFLGEHDFKAFTKNHKIDNTIRIIKTINFTVQDSLIKIEFVGNGFLHNMVRIIVAMLLEVARGKITKNDLERILASKNRKLAPKIAPPNGLYLVEVKY
jgi:tRNA pseudouridine38-40 synthase